LRNLYGSINKKERFSFLSPIEHIEYMLYCKVYCMYSLIHLKLHKYDVAQRVDGKSFGIAKILKKIKFLRCTQYIVEKGTNTRGMEV
jgi:hypothetical protein